MLAENRGFELVDPQQADIVLVSVCDVDDLPKVKQAKRIAGSKPLLMGGAEAYCGRAWLAWADYMWVGEAWEFFDTLRDYGWNEVIKHRSMFSREKPEAVASTYINWSEVPLVKTGNGTYYFLAGRGCSNKCKFCFTSWTKPHQTAPLKLMNAVIKTVEAKSKKMKLHFISNDYIGIPFSRCIINPTIRIRDYLEYPQKYMYAKSYHFGVERFSEKGRAEWGKPIANKELNQVMITLKELKKEAEFFFIVGLPNENEELKEFLDIIPFSISHMPRMHMKMTYLNASPHTMLQRYDLNQLKQLDRMKLYGELISRNKQWRTFQIRSLSREIWRTLFKRCNEQQVLELGMPPDAIISTIDYLKKIRNNGLGELINGQQKHLPWDGIVIK